MQAALRPLPFFSVVSDRGRIYRGIKVCAGAVAPMKRLPKPCFRQPSSVDANQRLDLFQQLTDTVYSPYTGPGWAPKPYKEEKGRYLWTDAFGVCNYITLACETGEERRLDQADALIAAVHDTLGRERHSSRRLGDATAGSPTRGGLRIGKAHAEGHPDGDGQYFHYLTKWMVALNRMSAARRDSKYNSWAIELAKAVHPRFVYDRDRPRPRMHWKVSIDLARPLVPSEGNLDPYDGLVTYRLLREGCGGRSVLDEEISDMERIVAHKYPGYDSQDPLDLGEALWLAHWGLPDEEWAQVVSQRSLASLEELWQGGYFRMPEHFRLAFREFGATLGTQVNPLAAEGWIPRVEQLHAFWADQLFTRDADITPVMFCASLVPGVWDRAYDKL